MSEPERATSGGPGTGRGSSGAHTSNGLRAIAICVLLAAATSMVPATARAAACCLSTSTFGAGRLAIWEDAAVGAHLSFSTSAGAFDGEARYAPHRDYAEREGRLTAFALLRLGESLEAGARVPWVMGSRAAGALRERDGGPGDVALSLRWQAIDLGAWDELPGVAFTLGATLPVGRSVEESERLLGADVTGRGYAVLSAGISLERAFDPWYLRLDAAGLLPLAHEVQGRSWRAGPGIEIQFGGGVDLGGGVIVALAPRLRFESEALREGERVPRSSTLELAVGPAASWAFAPRWTLLASFESGIPVDGLGRNRTLQTSASVGIRHGIH